MLALFTFGPIVAQSFGVVPVASPTAVEKACVEWDFYYDIWSPPFVEVNNALYASGEDCLRKCAADKGCVGLQFKSDLQRQCYSFSEYPIDKDRYQSRDMDDRTGLAPKWSLFLKTERSLIGGAARLRGIDPPGWRAGMGSADMERERRRRERDGRRS